MANNTTTEKPVAKEKTAPKAAPKENKRAALIAARNAKLITAYKGGMAVPDLAKKFGISPVYGYRILTKAGITLRARPKAIPPTKKTTTKKTTNKKGAKKAPVGAPALSKAHSARRAATA